MATALENETLIPSAEAPIQPIAHEPADLHKETDKGQLDKLEGYLEAIEHAPTTQTIVDETSGQPVLHSVTVNPAQVFDNSADPKNPKIKIALHQPIVNAVRWLVEFWLRIVKKENREGQAD